MSSTKSNDTDSNLVPESIRRPPNEAITEEQENKTLEEDTVVIATELIKKFIISTEETVSSLKNDISVQKKEYDSIFEKIILEKESSRNDISIIFTKFFIVFISMCFGYILFGSIASGVGLDVKLTESINALLELVKVAVFPLAMLIFGFHFGNNSSASLKTGLLNILDYLKKQSDNTKNPKEIKGNG